MSNELKVMGGEWRVEENYCEEYGESDICPLAIFAGDYQIASVIGDVLNMDHKANAHLLAASKKLYEALIVAEEVIFTFEGEKLRDKFPLTLADIRAALAAARGEDQ